MSLRPIIISDEPFLWEMLYLALYVPPGQPPFPRDILRDPDIACYVPGWVRPGDWGLLACDGELPVGAIWLRQWSVMNSLLPLLPHFIEPYDYWNPYKENPDDI